MHYYSTYGIPGTTYIYILLGKFILYMEYLMLTAWNFLLHGTTNMYNHKTQKRYYVYGRNKQESCIRTKRSPALTRFRHFSSQTRLMCLVSSHGLHGLSTEHSWLGIDTFSTFCMTNDKTDFKGTPKNTHKPVTGVLGNDNKALISLYGPGTFYIMDDAGESCDIEIPDLHYCATVPYRLLSPQHVDRVWRQHGMGTMKSTTDTTGTVLEWTDSTGSYHTKTIQHTSQSNLPLCYTAPSYRGYDNFLRSYQDLDDNRLCACMAEIQQENNNYTTTDEVHSLPAEIIDTTNEINIADFEHIDTTAIPEKDDNTTMDPTTEKLYWHYKLGHIPFPVLNRLSENGQVPKRLHKIMDPKCAACMFGQSTKRPWRTKTKPNAIGTLTKIEKPGDCVSVDQMVSPVPGLIAQIKGFPTKERYNAATIFVDHYSDLTFCHLQPNLKANETIYAKEAFERFCNSHGVKVRHYHADNGRFAETAFMAHVATMGQTISFCGVNAHFQNGKAERRIRTLQDIARTQLLHAIRKWPLAITTHLWPYAITNVANILNDIPAKGTTKSRLQLFSGSPIDPNIKHHHHIGIPVYVLNEEMQSGKKIPKWASRARVGIVRE